MFEGQSYEHILPPGLKWLNLIEPYRKGIKEYVEPRGSRRHKYFHHLNSSQAFTFNPFLPFFLDGAPASRALSAAFGFDGDVDAPEVEAVPDEAEGTNIDVCWRLRGNGTVLCEITLSESEFGSAADDPVHEKKWRDVYTPVLRGKVGDSALERRYFFRHYQLLRNLWHVARASDAQLVIFLPRANAALRPALDRLLPTLRADLRSRVHVRYVEDILGALAENESLSLRLRWLVAALQEKYLPETFSASVRTPR